MLITWEKKEAAHLLNTTMDKTIIVCISTVVIMWIMKGRYTYASCQPDINGLFRFGSKCKHMCHCKNVMEQCDEKDGTCITSGCADAWMGPGCQYRDITAMEKSQHSSNIRSPQYPERAIDGDITTCSRTSTNDNNPWWRLWLPRQELITGLVLVTERDKLDNFKKFNVTVEEDSKEPTIKSPNSSTRQLCYTYPYMTPLSNTIEVTCDQPLMGNQVRIQLDGSSTQLVICDIRIYGGKNVAFGKQTSQSSYYAGTSSNSSVTVDGVIEYSSNKCSSTQQENHPWWSVDLNYIMSIQAVHILTSINGLRNFRLHARNDSNDNWITLYDGSRNNIFIKYLTLVANTRYLRLYSMGNVTLQICEVQVFGECNASRWGLGCDNLCGSCLNAGPCSVQTGHCPQGCKYGYKHTTACESGCLPGFYGENCIQNCSNHCKYGYENCNNVNGICEQLCEAGWKGVMCDQECANRSFGENCLQPCGHCLHGLCDRVSGNCTGGCMAGYRYTTLCVDECVSGTFGDNCSQNCSDNCKGGYGSCNKINGTCEQLCEAGWKGVLCNKECSDGTYGISCLGTCGNCEGGIANCEKVTGTCVHGCADGFVGYVCIKASSSPQAAIVGGVSAAAAVVVAAVVIVVVLRHRRKKRSNTQGYENQHDAFPSVVYNADNPTNKYDALQVTHGEVNPYDTLDTTEEDTGVYEAMES